MLTAITLGGAAAGAGGSSGGTAIAAAGAVSINIAKNNALAYIDAGSDVKTLGSGAVVISATDGAVMSAIAGGLAGSGAGGSGGGTAGSLGAAIAVNTVVDEASAYIEASKVASAGSVELTATGASVISALSIGAAVAGAGGAGGGFGGAGAGSASGCRKGRSCSARCCSRRRDSRGGRCACSTGRERRRIIRSCRDGGAIALRLCHTLIEIISGDDVLQHWCERARSFQFAGAMGIDDGV